MIGGKERTITHREGVDPTRANVTALNESEKNDRESHQIFVHLGNAFNRSTIVDNSDCKHGYPTYLEVPNCGFVPAFVSWRWICLSIQPLGMMVNKSNEANLVNGTTSDERTPKWLSNASIRSNDVDAISNQNKKKTTESLNCLHAAKMSIFITNG